MNIWYYKSYYLYTKVEAANKDPIASKSQQSRSNLEVVASETYFHPCKDVSRQYVWKAWPTKDWFLDRRNFSFITLALIKTGSFSCPWSWRIFMLKIYENQIYLWLNNILKVTNCNIKRSIAPKYAIQIRYGFPHDSIFSMLSHIVPRIICGYVIICVVVPPVLAFQWALLSIIFNKQHGLCPCRWQILFINIMLKAKWWCFPHTIIIDTMFKWMVMTGL